MFDVNPNPSLEQRRSTTIVGADTFPEEIDGLLSLADDCSLTTTAARERLGRIAASLAQWRDAARRNGIAEPEITMMAESIEPRLEAVARAGA